MAECQYFHMPNTQSSKLVQAVIQLFANLDRLELHHVKVKSFLYPTYKAALNPLSIYISME